MAIIAVGSTSSLLNSNVMGWMNTPLRCPRCPAKRALAARHSRTRRAQRAPTMGAVARGTTWLFLAAAVRPAAGMVTSLAITSALRLTPTSALRSPLSRARTRKLVVQSSWTTVVDEASGSAYYYNEQTGESQWESPQQNYGAEVVWRVAGLCGVDAGHTLRAGDERVLSRWNMLSQKLTVSRKQGVVQCHGDGTATLTSEGKGPTLWREQDGPWCALQRGGAVYLSENDQVSLDCSDPESAVFMVYLCTCQSNMCTCRSSPRYQQGGSMQQGGSVQQSGSVQQDGSGEEQGQPQLPYPWQVLVDQNGTVYYSNPQTGEASWDPPQW